MRFEIDGLQEGSTMHLEGMLYSGWNPNGPMGWTIQQATEIHGKYPFAGKKQLRPAMRMLLNRMPW